MGQAASNSGDPFDLGRIRKLAELMEDHDLSEVEIQSGEIKVAVRRGSSMVAPVAHIAAAQPAVAQSAPSAAGESQPSADDSKLHTIKSPVVGTFFNAAKPGAPPFVKPGDVVDPETVVCIVEAMKVFNEIPAGVSGKIVRALVQNEQAVEYDQGLFAVEPS